MNPLETWIAILSALVTINGGILAYLASEVRYLAREQGMHNERVGRIMQTLRNPPFNIDFGDR